MKRRAYCHADAVGTICTSTIACAENVGLTYRRTIRRQRPSCCVGRRASAYRRVSSTRRLHCGIGSHPRLATAAASCRLCGARGRGRHGSGASSPGPRGSCVASAHAGNHGRSACDACCRAPAAAALCMPATVPAMGSAAGAAGAGSRASMAGSGAQATTHQMKHSGAPCSTARARVLVAMHLYMSVAAVSGSTNAGSPSSACGRRWLRRHSASLTLDHEWSGRDERTSAF